MKLNRLISLYKTIALLLAAIIFMTACASAPITGRKQLMLISESQAIRESEPAYFKMLEKPAAQGKLDNDPKLKARVEMITGRIIAQAIKYRPETANWQWSIHIIDDPMVVNAWAMAGGRMALYTGLVEQINPSDDELAQVLGHEIAHALAKHTAEKMSVALATNVAIAAIAITQENKNSLALQGAALAAVLAIELPNSRTAESEADRIGIEIAARAGYNPNAAVSLWQKMAKLGGGERTLEFLSTHPAPTTRINDLSKLAQQMMPYYQARGARPVYQCKPEATRLPGKTR